MKLVPRFRRHLSQYTNVTAQSISDIDNTNFINPNGNFRINIKNEVNKLLQNPQLNDNLFRFCVTANTCAVSSQLRIFLSNLVPKNVDLKFTNSKSILQHQKFTVIFVLKSLSRLPSLVYTNNRYEDNTSDQDLSLVKLLSLNDIFKLSVQSLASRYKGRIEEHAREVSEIFDSLIDTCKFVSRHNLSHIYSYLNNTISSFATNISNDLVAEFSDKKRNLYPLIFSIGKFLEIHGIKNKELYDIIYHSICNPDKWIHMDYSRSNYQKFLLDSITKLLQFKLPQDNIDKITHYLLVSDILPINCWSTLFLYLTRFSFKKTTLDLALMTFVRKYKYCKFPAKTNTDSAINNSGEIEYIPSVTSLVKSIDLTSNNVYYNIDATRTCHDKTYTQVIGLETDYTYDIICGITNIKKRIKLDDATISYIDEVLELLWPRVNQFLPTYSLLQLKPIATSYIDLITNHITSFSDIGYSTKQRNIVNSIAAELLKFAPTFTLPDYIQCADIFSRLHCNIAYNDEPSVGGFVANQLAIDAINGVFDENISGMTAQEQIFTLDFPSCVKLSLHLFKVKQSDTIAHIGIDKINELTILLKERIITCVSSMNQDHWNANSYSIVLLNMISSKFKGITQFMETLDGVARCVKILSVYHKIDILRITTGQCVNEDFVSVLIEELRQDVSNSQNKLQLFKCIIVLKRLIETVDHNYMNTFLLYATPNIYHGEFIGELLDISTKIEPTDDISKQFIIATLISASNKQLTISQLRDYLKCCRLIGHKFDNSKCMDVPLYNANIQQIESILSEITRSRICDVKAIKRLVDWSIHLHSSEDSNTNNSSICVALNCFAKILSHLSFFNITNSKLIGLSLSLIDKYHNDYQSQIISMLNSLLKFDQYPNNFEEIFTNLLVYTNNTDNLSSDTYRQLYEIYIQSLPTDKSLHQNLESKQLIELLNGLPSYHWFKDQEMVANEFKNTTMYSVFFDAICEITGIKPTPCAINPYFVHYLFEDTHHSKYNNLVILLITPSDKIYDGNELCGDALLRVKYLKKLGYKVVTVDSCILNSTDLKSKLDKML